MYAEAQIRIGVYYTEHIEADEEQIRTQIKDAFARSSARIGAIFMPAFFKKAPIATTLITTRMIEGRRQGSRTTENGILGDETLIAFENSPNIRGDITDTDFIIVLTPLLLFEEPTRGSTYDWSNGLANLGGKIALIQYDAEMDIKSLEYTFAHELGHLLGVPHTNRDLCGETNYLMCGKAHWIQESTIVKRLRGNVIEFATVIKERLKEWVLDDRYRAALENYSKRKK